MKKNISSASVILKNNFIKLKKANKNFSLRALSLKTDVSHVFLSKLFSGKSKASPELLEKLILHLKIDMQEASTLRGISLPVIKEIKNDTSEYAASPENHLFIMRKWWNFAILDLLTCDLNINFNSETISMFLPIDKIEIEQSLKQLLDIGLIQKTKNGYKKTEAKIRIPTRGPNESTRAFYKQTLKLASDQLDKTKPEDFESRSILGFTCAVNKKNVPVVKQKLAAALRECAELLSEGPCDDVYLVQGQMFSVLKK